MPTPIATALLEETLLALPGWEGDASQIWREVHLADDLDVELRRQVDVDATAMGHLPVVERVPGGTRFSLRTDDAVSELDIALAAHISDLAHRITPREPGIDAVRDGDVDQQAEAEAALVSDTSTAPVPRDVRF